MKITFEGVTRALELDRNASLGKLRAIQDYTGLTAMDWRMALVTRDVDTLAGAGAGAVTAAQAAGKMTALTDMGWIRNMAAAHWLMLAQNEEDPPPLDDDYDPDVMGFADAFFTALLEEAKAKAAQDKPGPTARGARRTPSSRRTVTPEKARGAPPPPSTGS